jgi:signal recognition particle subunit SRP54
MVLAELGGRLRESLRKLQGGTAATTLDDLDAVLAEISRALIEADVNVRYVLQLRDNVRRKIAPVLPPPVTGADGGDGSSTSARQQQQRAGAIGKLVQRAVVDELTALLQTRQKPYEMRRGKCNVILFVGLQGAGKVRPCGCWSICCVCVLFIVSFLLLFGAASCVTFC